MNECMSKVERRAIMGKRLMTVCVVALMMMAVMCVPVLAANTTGAITSIQDGVKKGTSEIYGVIKTIVIPVAAVYMGFGIFSMLFDGQKGMESGKKKILIGAIVIAGVQFAPIIAETVSSWFTNVGTSVFN